MNAEAVSLIIGAVVQGLGTLAEIKAIARQVQSGVPITDAQLAAGRQAVSDAIARWDDAAEHDRA